MMHKEFSLLGRVPPEDLSAPPETPFVAQEVTLLFSGAQIDFLASHEGGT